MENLSTVEASLLLLVQKNPLRPLSEHGGKLSFPYIQVLHARNRLRQLALVHEDHECRMQIDEHTIEKWNNEITVEHFGNVVVHKLDNPDIEIKLLGGEQVQKFEDVDNKVLAMLKNSPNGRTAKELATPFGTKGTSLNWTLRNLIKKQAIVKRDTKYFIAEEGDKVVHLEFPKDERRLVETDLEIRTFILQQGGEFTLSQCYANVTRLFNIDKERFSAVFTDLVLDGYYNVHDGSGYVKHDLDFCADNLHSRALKVSSAQGIEELVDDFLVTAKNPFSLEDIVRATELRHDLITDKLAHRGYNTTNQTNIFKRVKTEPEDKGYSRFDDIDIQAAQQLIFGIVKIDVFMRRFNLDPALKHHVIDSLTRIKLASYDTVSGFLGPVKSEKKVEVSQDVEEIIQEDVQKQEVVLEQAPQPVEENVTKFVQDEPVAEVSPPVVAMPTHIDNPSSPLYGHAILSRNGAPDGSSLAVSSTADEEWIAKNPRPFDAAHVLKSLTREHIIERLAENPASAVAKAQESEEPEIAEYLENLNVKTPLKSPSDPESRLKSPGVISGASSGDNGPRGPSGIPGDYASAPPQETVNSVDQRWLFTLQMLEERFFHEHQGTTAKILREIREHLAP